MKRILSILSLLLIANMSMAQSEVPAVDKSPMDMSYFPVNYPLLKVQDKATTPAIARVVYSRPKKEGRGVFGDLVAYGKLWRVGANEATELEFFRAVTIAGKKIPKGRYTVFAIVNEKSWTLIINKDTDVWGSFKYNQAKDVVRVDVPVQKVQESVEALSMYFEKTTTGASFIISWENTKVAMPITL